LANQKEDLGQKQGKDTLLFAFEKKKQLPAGSGVQCIISFYYCSVILHLRQA
jgi:hypothetical protein